MMLRALSRAMGLAVALAAGGTATAEGQSPPAPSPPSAASAPTPTAASTSPPPRVTVLRVFDGGSRAVVFDRSSGEYDVVRVGDSIQGLRVARIEPDQLVLDAGDGVRLFVLPATAAPLVEGVPARSASPWSPPAAPRAEQVVDPYAPDVPAPAPDQPVDPYPSPAPSLAPAPASPPAPAPPPVPMPVSPTASAPAPASPRRTHRATIRRADLDAALADFATLGREVTVEATAGGVLLATVAAGSLVGRIGLRSGDVVRTVAGRPLTSVEDAAAIYAVVLAARTVDIDLERRGVAQRIRVGIRP